MVGKLEEPSMTAHTALFPSLSLHDVLVVKGSFAGHWKIFTLLIRLCLIDLPEMI